MSGRGQRTPSAPRKLYYTVPELADLAGVSERRMRGLLEVNKVELTRAPAPGLNPRASVVFVSRLAEALPECLDSARLVNGYEF